MRTNTTVYSNSDLDDVSRLFQTLADSGVDGVDGVAGVQLRRGRQRHLPDPRRRRTTSFASWRRTARRFRYCNTPVYWDFLSGRRALDCTPWSNPTRNPIGWKRPCYLITDGHVSTFRELMEETDWEKYGAGNDARCANCMLHSGYEASAIEAAGRQRPGPLADGEAGRLSA